MPVSVPRSSVTTSRLTALSVIFVRAASTATSSRMHRTGTDITIESALNDVAQLREAYESDARIKELLDIGQRLEGLTRHASTHAAVGMIVTDGEVPLSVFA